MRKKISISTTVTLIILTVALTISLTMMLAMRYFNSQLQLVGQRQAMYDHINSVDKIVREYYPDVDEKNLRQSIAQGYVYGLKDPYAVYYSPSRYESEKLRMQGKANNVGISLCLNAKGETVVGRVQPDSPAGKADVQVGDVIIAMDGESIEGKSLLELQHHVSTAEKVLLKVKRGEEKHAFDLSTYQYTVRSVQGTMLGNIGYVRITAFYENTPDQFRATVSSMLSKGAVGLIFDLRNNAGGYSTAAQEMLTYMLPLGSYGMTVDNHRVITKLSSTANNQIGVSTVTLVNSGTAGEAEFFAGVLKEFSLTTVVGETTAGKAKIQDYFVLESDSSALKLTVGEYALLKGGSWQDVGILPTVKVALPADQAAIAQLIPPDQDAQVAVAVEQLTVTENKPNLNSSTTGSAHTSTTDTASVGDTTTETQTKKTEKATESEDE